MTGPIVFISRFMVKEGKLNALKQFAQAMTEQIQADKPGSVVFLQYLNEDETEQSLIHVFPDAEAMDRHSEGVAERAKPRSSSSSVPAAKYMGCRATTPWQFRNHPMDRGFHLITCPNPWAATFA